MTDVELANAVADFCEEKPYYISVRVYKNIPGFLRMDYEFVGIKQKISLAVFKEGNEDFPEEVIKHMAGEIIKQKKKEERKLLKGLMI